MTSEVEKLIEEARKDEYDILEAQKWARVEQRRILAESEGSPQEKYDQIKEINRPIAGSKRGLFLTTLQLPVQIRDLADTLVSLGYFPNRSELYRTAIADFIMRWADIFAKIKV